MLKKTFYNKCSHVDNSNKGWFDNECIIALHLYKTALSKFNLCESYENRRELCNFKKNNYKSLIRKKKNNNKEKSYRT